MQWKYVSHIQKIIFVQWKYVSHIQSQICGLMRDKYSPPPTPPPHHHQHPSHHPSHVPQPLEPTIQKERKNQGLIEIISLHWVEGIFANLVDGWWLVSYVIHNYKQQLTIQRNFGNDSTKHYFYSSVCSIVKVLVTDVTRCLSSPLVNSQAVFIAWVIAYVLAALWWFLFFKYGCKKEFSCFSVYLPIFQSLPFYNIYII